MRIPLSWLAEVVSWNEDTAALVERMTMTGLKVEAVSEVGDLDARIRVARLESVEPHPEAESLAICRLDLGGEHLTVVSAAPGLRRDRRVVVAQAGAALPAGPPGGGPGAPGRPPGGGPSPQARPRPPRGAVPGAPRAGPHAPPRPPAPP